MKARWDVRLPTFRRRTDKFDYGETMAIFGGLLVRGGNFEKNISDNTCGFDF